MQNTEKKKSANFPEKGDIVLGTVSKVFPHGAFVKLDEYPGKDGMIHISEISTKWIKNINDYVNEGDKVVVKVLRIDREKGHIDLSLKSVKAIQKKQKLDSYKNTKKAEKLLQLAANNLKNDGNLKTISEKLEAKYGDAYSALEAASKEGETAFSGMGLPGEWAKELAKIAQESVTIPKVTIKAVYELKSQASNGAEVIRNALSEALEKNESPDLEISLKYMGAPKYKLELTGENYKLMEKCLESITNTLTSEMKKGHGTISVERQGR